MAGVIADLEFGSRVPATASEKATFGVNATSLVAKRRAAAHSKLNQPLLNEILAVYQSIGLK